jgi:hypothetical protein
VSAAKPSPRGADTVQVNDLDALRDKLAGTVTERQATDAAKAARDAIALAIAAYERVGFGSHVTDPLRTAYAEVCWSIKEATS